MPSKFIITCAARTGSTMLRYLLDSHPQICCHGEAFIRQGYLRFIFKNRRSFGLAPGYKEFLPKFKSKPLEDFLTDDFLHTSDESVKAIGFKFKTDEYFDSGYQEISRYLKSRDEIRVIHLRRQDLLAQYISYLFVHKKYNPTVSFDKEHVSSQKRLVIKQNKLQRYLSLVTQREEAIEANLSGHLLHRVWYEDLVNDRDKHLGDILEFLGVDKVIPPPATKKLIKDYEQHISNLSEVHHWIKEAGLGHRLSTAQNDPA